MSNAGRYYKGYGKPCPRVIYHFYPATDLLDVVSDYVHANTTAGVYSGIFKSGKPRKKQKL